MWPNYIQILIITYPVPFPNNENIAHKTTDLGGRFGVVFKKLYELGQVTIFKIWQADFLTHVDRTG